MFFINPKNVASLHSSRICLFSWFLEVSNGFYMVSIYPLVNIQKAIENGPVEIVDLPINSMVIFHSYVSLPEGKSQNYLQIFIHRNLEISVYPCQIISPYLVVKSSCDISVGGSPKNLPCFRNLPLVFSHSCIAMGFFLDGSNLRIVTISGRNP